MVDVTITALAVHPVKSCRGIDTDRADTTPTGLALDGVRDREWMVIDARGRFVTQRELPRLALIAPSIERGALALRIPGLDPVPLRATAAPRDVVVWRSQVRGLDAGDKVAQALSAFLDHDVRLVRFDDGKPRPCSPDFVGDSGATTLYTDGYPVLVVGQASLDDLNVRLAARGFPAMPMNRFRPNVVVDGLEPFEEDHIGSIAFGDLVLKLVKPCTRCAITTTDQDTGRRNIEPLRTLAAYRRNDRSGGVTFGMNAIVAAGPGAPLSRGMPGRAQFRF